MVTTCSKNSILPLPELVICTGLVADSPTYKFSVAIFSTAKYALSKEYEFIVKSLSVLDSFDPLSTYVIVWASLNKPPAYECCTASQLAVFSKLNSTKSEACQFALLGFSILNVGLLRLLMLNSEIEYPPDPVWLIMEIVPGL